MADRAESPKAMYGLNLKCFHRLVFQILVSKLVVLFREGLELLGGVT